MGNELEQIKAILESMIGKPEEQKTLDGLKEYIAGRAQDIEATAKA